MRHCQICNNTQSESWWKCCPDHTTEQGPDVVCQQCTYALHSDLSFLGYGSDAHNKHISKGLCDSINKKHDFCRLPAHHRGVHHSVSQEATNASMTVWQPTQELPREVQYEKSQT